MVTRPICHEGFFGFMSGLPLCEQRITRDNVKINDVLHYMIDGRPVYSVVLYKTNTMIKVKDLYCEITMDAIHLYLKDEVNPITKCELCFSRKMFKVSNILYTI